MADKPPSEYQQKREAVYDARWRQSVEESLRRIYQKVSDVSETVQKLQDDRLLAAVEPAPADGPGKLYSLKETAAMLGLSSGTIRSDGPTITRAGKRIMFSAEDIQRWKELHREPRDDYERNWAPSAVGSHSFPTPPKLSRGRPMCLGSEQTPKRLSRYSGRGVCRVCNDDVLIKTDGMLRRHPFR